MKPPASQPGRHILDGTIRIFLAEALLLPTGILTAAYPYPSVWSRRLRFIYAGGNADCLDRVECHLSFYPRND